MHVIFLRDSEAKQGLLVVFYVPTAGLLLLGRRDDGFDGVVVDDCRWPIRLTVLCATPLSGLHRLTNRRRGRQTHEEEEGRQANITVLLIL
jgi:hypothetical protein